MIIRKNYKEGEIDKNMQGKRGQVTLFVIIALVLVVVIVVVLVYPRIKPSIISPSISDPKAYLTSCIEPTLRKQLQVIGDNGGVMEPEASVMNEGKEIRYLCYSSEYYKTCTVQDPLIKERIEDELTKSMQSKVESCVQQFVDENKRKGYTVSVGEVSGFITLNPNNVEISVVAPMTITQETSRNYKVFNLDIDSQMYDLATIASSIVSFEATYGDSEITTYLQYYPELKIQKTKLSDGTTIYIVSNVLTKESFTFASRSMPWPAGFPEENL